MKTLTTIFIFLSIILRVQGQNIDSLEFIDSFEINGITIKVYFNDPLNELLKKYPDFDSKDNNTKHELLSKQLHNSALYIFQAINKKGILKTYILKGNPQKVRTKYYFDLDILKADGTIDKIIEKTYVGGSFFEHMNIFQNTKGKKLVGNGAQIWGFFVKIEPYENIKNTVSELIKKDIENSIPDDIMYKEEPKIEPLFDYQTCGLATITKRVFTITVLRYNSLGQIISKHPRTETDTELYLSSTSNDLISVATFPFFSSTDKKVIKDNKIIVTSSLENINYYLKDIVVTQKPDSQHIDRIEAKLIIHIFSETGQTTNEELYIAEFESIGNCYFPKTVKFCPINDKNYEKPRLKIDIEYELK